MPVFEDTPDRLRKLLNAQEKKISKAFYAVIAAAKADLDLDTLTDLLERGDLDTAFGIIDRAAISLGDAYVTAAVAAGQSTAAWVSSTGAISATVAFNQIHPLFVEAAQNSHFQLVNGLTQDQRAMLRNVVSRGIIAGDNPRQQAVAFRDAIGLTTTQETYVANYRRALETNNTAASLNRELRDRRSDGVVARAAANDDALSQKQVNRLVGHYRQRMIAHRAEVIARTEALRAIHEGHNAMIYQLAQRADIGPDVIIRIWNVTIDGRERSTHHTMSRQERGAFEPFLTGGGVLLQYPGDITAPPEEVINCRCVLTTRLILPD